MASLGQASGGFTESNSALRVYHRGIYNSTGLLTDDAFTQANPVSANANVSAKVNVTARGVLAGSVAFARPDGKSGGTDVSGYVGGPKTGLAVGKKEFVSPVGIFVNSAQGNDFENLPAVASGRGTYACGFGTYGSQLYETKAQVDSSTVNGQTVAAAAALVYVPGVKLMASINGFLMPTHQEKGGELCVFSSTNNSHEVVNGTSATVVGVCRIAPDAALSEVAFDLRV